MQTKKESMGGEVIKVEGHDFTLKPERDFFRGVPTILNSEAAAIA